MSDAAFAARVGRISNGRQWVPDGAIQPRFRGRRRKPLPLMHRPGIRFTLLVTGVGCAVVAALDPSLVPAGVVESAVDGAVRMVSSML